MQTCSPKVPERMWFREGFPSGSAGKESACNVGDVGSIPGLGRSPEEGNGYPFQYSGLENSMNCSSFHFQIVQDVLGGDGLVTKFCPTLVTLWTVARQAPLSLGSLR